MRYIQYQYALVEPDYPMPTRGKWYAESGVWHHDWMRLLIKEAFAGTENKLIDYVTPKGKTLWNPMDNKWDYEFPLVRKKYRIYKSKVDAVMILGGELWLGEYKTLTKNAWDKGLLRPKPEHLMQGSIVLDIFNYNLKVGKFAHIPELKGFTAAKGIIFIYINKDNPIDKKEFRIVNPSKVISAVKAKMAQVRAAIKGKKLLSKTQHFCDGCEFRDKCAKNFIPEPD